MKKQHKIAIIVIVLACAALTIFDPAAASPVKQPVCYSEDIIADAYTRGQRETFKQVDDLFHRLCFAGHQQDLGNGYVLKCERQR